MTPRICKGCGSELFEAQRFCRACGRPTDELVDEHAPTQMMQPQPETWGARSSANTAPASRQGTSPVAQEQSYYQAQFPPVQQAYTPPPAFVPPARRSPIGWILAFIGIGVFAAIIFAVMFVARQGRRFINDMPRGPAVEMTQQAGETVLGEGTADMVESSPGEITFTKSVSLAPDARVALKNVRGDITIGVWDKPQAVVKVTKRGSEGERRNVQVFLANEKGNLSLRTGQRRGTEVRYEITLPRQVGELAITTVSGDIRVSDLSGRIRFENVEGSNDLINVTGLSAGKSVNGDIKVTLTKWGDHGLDLQSVNGDVLLQVKSGLDAQFEAETIGGNISVDDSYGISIERRMVGEKASGTIGTGRQRLSIKTVGGNISLRK